MRIRGGTPAGRRRSGSGSGMLLAGDAYPGLEAETKARLMDEIPPLAFPARGTDHSGRSGLAGGFGRRSFEKAVNCVPASLGRQGGDGLLNVLLAQLPALVR